jgi:hypothetical protein
MDGNRRYSTLSWRARKARVPEEARFSTRRQTKWAGHKVHLTETCDVALPRIITEVQTTLAPIADGAMTTPIHAVLQANDLLPTDHLFDTAYLDAEPLRFDRNHNNSPSTPPEHGRKQKRSKNRLPTAPGLRARFCWACARSTYAEPATWVWRKPICNIF